MRVRVGIGAAVVLVVVALVCSVLVTALSPVGATTVFGGPPSGAPGTSSSTPTSGAAAETTPRASDSAPSSDAEAGGAGAGGAGAGGTSATILVHVLGAVASPGVYELPEASRVIDAVAAAGGLAEAADQASVNLARVLVDGEQLRILAVGEVPPPIVGAGSGAGTGGSGSASVGGTSGSAGGAGSAGAAAVVNLNAATELDLDGLPRIGPAMAARIIAWRADNGPFTSVDDLLQIPGIGDKTLESLRPLVTV
ncbi:ComEA family DNA-binding protein [Herbiconiux solani]|uniref:ComEA family DNA-binding protein n=1 Tax=Herbiconiux solani TaxID=661329 RepID=UPI001FE21A39|nr:helix-hairpin-helix domain-containing protein [Herbiconiux solani]